MNLFWRKNRKNVEPPKSSIIPASDRYKKFLDAIIQEKSFDVTKIIDSGYFGATIIIKQNETGEDVKIRILREEYAGEKESEWGKFNHSNLLPLLKMEYLKNIDSHSYLFYSPLEETNLHDKVQDKQFKKDSEALWKLINWLEKIADGVQYLHSCAVAHLNLQAKSMIITKEGVVQISDFHCLSSTKHRTDKFGFPQALRCPEAFLNYGGTWPVKPGPFDSWSLGILIIELFTGFYLSKKLTKKVTTWTKEAYPTIFDVLKKYKFNRLVLKAFPKAYGTVDLKPIRYLSAYTLTFDPSNRPSAKHLHSLFIMLNIQKKFFSKIKMEFRKDKIWENKIEWKKFQKHFLELSAKDNLELLREDNLKKSGVQPESSLDTRSVPKEEKDSVAKEAHTKADEKVEKGLKKVDGLLINNIKQKSKKEEQVLLKTAIINNMKQKRKKEEQVLLKTEDTIKMAYTAFTFHDASSFETSVFDLKSVGSELPGLSLDKTTTSSSKIAQLQKNIENSSLYIGDVSPIRQMEQFKANSQNSTLHTLDTSLQPKIIVNELQENGKEIGSNSDVHSGKKSTDGREKEVKTGQNFFSLGKQFMNRLIKWSITGYEMTSYDYELTSSKNRLHTLSKHLTK